MTLRIGLALAVALMSCGRAEAQDGGKIPWKGKGKDDDLKAIMADAKKEDKAILFFFTSEG